MMPIEPFHSKNSVKLPNFQDKRNLKRMVVMIPKSNQDNLLLLEQVIQIPGLTAKLMKTWMNLGTVKKLKEESKNMKMLSSESLKQQENSLAS